MPVRIPDALPATRQLEEENIFVMTERRAATQDIRPLRIAILNLMPTKIKTETQLLRVLGNTPLQVEVVLLTTESHTPTNTSQEHLASFYHTFSEVKDQKFDGLVITGAPVERMRFEEVDYWDELKDIMDWADRHVFSTLHICWAAQAGLYYHHGVHKHLLPDKMFGVFAHRVNVPTHKLMRGFDDTFYAPHSRHTMVRREAILRCPELELLAESDEAGVLIAATGDGRKVYVTGHLEYDYDTLQLEYERDIARGMDIDIPKNYYPHDDPQARPVVTWRAHANLFFSNWLNYFVYQETPYDINIIE